jgi:hypothetical protein
MFDPFMQVIGAIFGVSGQTTAVIFVALLFFIIIFIDFGIIFKNLTAFSSVVAWILAFGMAILATLSGVVATIVMFFIPLFGYIGATLVLLALKVGSTIIELMIAKKLKSKKEFRKKLKKEKYDKFIEYLKL